MSSNNKDFLIFSISNPAIVNKKQALIMLVVYVTTGSYFDMSVVLLKKQNDKWRIDTCYYDPSFVW